jgi:urease gamma subunit
MIVKKVKEYTIQKDGTSYYRVKRKRTRIGSFLNLSDAIAYLELKVNEGIRNEYVFK